VTGISKTSSITKMASISSSNWGSSISSMCNWGSSISSMSNWGSSISSMSNWGSSVSSMSNWGSSSISSNWDLSDSMDWGSDSLRNSLDGVGAGFVNNWLVDSLVGPDRSVDGLGAIGGDVLEDGLGNVVSSDNGGGLVRGNWGRDVGVGGLSHRVGQGGDLGDDLSKSMSLSGRVGKVASQPVVLDGSRVMCWGTDKVGGSIANNGSAGNYPNSSSTAKSDESGEKQEGVHGGSR